MLDVMGAKAQILLQNWYASPVDRIDEFQISSGARLEKQQVAGLVEAWSQYDAGTLNRAGLDGVVATSWQAA